MPPAQTPAPRNPNRTLDHFRNEAGAFDLPSILVGVVVVGILTAGVLVAIFGVIPYAQDSGAKQDLDSLRTAQGVSKAKDSTYKATAGLDEAGLQKTRTSVATATDAAGSCYVGVSKSGSGKLFYSSSSAATAQLLTDTSDPGCITPAQLQELVTSVGGTFPDGPTPPVGNFTPVVQRAGMTSILTNYMNAKLALLASSEELAWRAASASADPSDNGPALTAYWQSQPYTAYDAAWKALETSGESYVQYQNFTLSDAVTDLRVASEAADAAFWANPDSATQRAGVDAEAAMYNTDILLNTRLVAAPGEPEVTSVTIAAGSEESFLAKVAMPAVVDTATPFPSDFPMGTARESLDSKAFMYSSPKWEFGWNEALGQVAMIGAPHWELEFFPAGGAWESGVYPTTFTLTDPATKIMYFKTITITVQ